VSENGTNGIQRIVGAFAQTGKRAALMPYLMGGYPTIADSARIGEACIAAGADIIELGMPYSDPLADGPVIHAAGTQALAAGANVAGVFEVARELAQSVPVVLMCYVNMVMACAAHGLALVPLVAPTTPPERLEAIGKSAQGFLYTVSVLGTTGERVELGERFAQVVARAKASTQAPVALGFGISTPEHALQAAQAGADGVIVGTRLVRAAGESEDPASAVGAVVGELAAGLALAR
jgi:tryptophan synthase alpha chain